MSLLTGIKNNYHSNLIRNFKASVNSILSLRFEIFSKICNADPILKIYFLKTCLSSLSSDRTISVKSVTTLRHPRNELLFAYCEISLQMKY